MWVDGSPPLVVGKWYVLEFEEGDRFMVVRVVSAGYAEDVSENQLEDLNDGGWVSDPVKRHLEIPPLD